MTENRADTLYSWLAAEHARLHVVASWKDTPRKNAALRAIRSSIASLAAAPENVGFTCVICSAERIVKMFPTRARLGPLANPHEKAA